MKTPSLFVISALVLVASAGCRDRARAQATTTTAASSIPSPIEPKPNGGAKVTAEGIIFPIGVSIPGYGSVEAGSDPDHWVVTKSSYQLVVWRATDADGKTPDEAAEAYRRQTNASTTPTTWKAWKTPGGYAAKFDLDSGVTGHTYFGEARKTFGTLGVMCQVVADVSGSKKEDARAARDEGLQDCQDMKAVATTK
jgi:hypothetical protein